MRPLTPNLERARDLLRHTIPHGDPPLIIDRALTVLVQQLEKRKAGHLSCAEGSRTRPSGTRSRGRHVPAAVRRLVWTRDQGRCAFVGARGRCSETGFLEYHHVVPFAAEVRPTRQTSSFAAARHNAYEADGVVREEGGPDAKAPGR
jgi:5-methylcytosine-specific restriction endonuclease McrA